MADSPHNISINQKAYKVAELLHDTPDVDVFKFKAEDGYRLKFDPGMFVMLTYSNPDTKEKITRAFSIASEPEGDTVDFFIHMIHGRITSKLETAQVGSIYYLTGPYGQFKFMPNEDRKVLFIAGGTGLAPFMSMLKYIRKLKSGTDVVLLYSIRFPNEIIRKEELEQLEKDIGMKMVITVTRQENSEGWDGERGHIDDVMIAKYTPDIMERTTYICGPLPFVKAMKDALAKLKVPNEKIKADVWG